MTTQKTTAELISLHHEDCFKAMKNIPDASVDLVLCDLPYGTTQCKWDTALPLDQLWAEWWRICKPNAAIVLTAAQPFTSALVMSQPQHFKYDLVWDKVKGTGFLNAKKMPMRNHESVLVFCRGKVTYNPQKTTGHSRKVSYKRSHLKTDVYGDMKNDCRYDSTERYPRSIQVFSTDTQSSNLHPTQKPVALMEWLIKTYSNERNTVLDCCMGSGTTGVACIKTGRNFIGIEKDEIYFNVAKDRIEQALQPKGEA